MTAAIAITLRNIVSADLDVFFEQQQDQEANIMAAFTSKDPHDRQAFDAHWAKIQADPAIVIRTIQAEGRIAGYVLHHAWFGEPEVSFWLGRDYWGRGIASAALAEFIRENTLRPMYARVAYDHAASLRVLEKCGFVLIGTDKGFSNSRGAEIEELILVLC